MIVFIYLPPLILIFPKGILPAFHSQSFLWYFYVIWILVSCCLSDTFFSEKPQAWTRRPPEIPSKQRFYDIHYILLWISCYSVTGFRDSFYNILFLLLPTWNILKSVFLLYRGSAVSPLESSGWRLTKFRVSLWFKTSLTYFSARNLIQYQLRWNPLPYDLKSVFTTLFSQVYFGTLPFYFSCFSYWEYFRSVTMRILLYLKVLYS